MPERITAQMLRDADACPKQVALFEKRWPDGVVPTMHQVPVAVRLGLDVGWAAGNLLSDAALKAYDEARAPAYKAYDEARAAAYKAYDEARATANKAYREAIAPAYKAYREAIAPAYKAYREARATAFVHAWRNNDV